MELFRNKLYICGSIEGKERVPPELTLLSFVNNNLIIH